MPRKYIKKKLVPRYSLEDLQRAVQDVKNKNCTYREASAQYNVPLAVIYHRIKGRNVQETKMGGGRAPVFSREVEEQIVECLKARARMGYPCNTDELRDLIQTYVKQKNLQTPFKDGRPGLDWYYSFMKRHRALSFKKPEHLQKARKDQRKPDVIYGFYKELEKVIAEKKIYNPSFVFNADESGFKNDPSRIKAIGERGKTLCRVSGGSGRESTSVLACVAADGSYLPPFIIFKGAAVQARWTSEEAYPGTVYSVSTNGWMEEPQFFNWFDKVFIKWVQDLREKQNLPDEVALLLYDGHKSHISLRIIEHAIQNKVVLVKFPSHLTDKIQPLDKSVFGPVKTCWEKKLIAYGKKQMGLGAGRLKKNQFAALLGEVWQEAFTDKNIKSGFVTSGIFPVDSGKFPEDEFNPDELKRFKEKQKKAAEDTKTQETQTDEATPGRSNTEKISKPEMQPVQFRASPSVSVISDTGPSETDHMSLKSSNSQFEVDSPCVTPALDIIAVFSETIKKTVAVSLNTKPAEPKKVTPRLKQDQYGEVLTTAEVIKRLSEAERLKEDKNNKIRKRQSPFQKGKGKPRLKKTTGRKTSKKHKENIVSDEDEDEIDPEQLCNDHSDEDMNEEEWAKEVLADSYTEIEYKQPEWCLIKPGTYLLVKFLGGSRKSTYYKYVCRIRSVDEEIGDIEVVGFTRNDKFSTEFVEKENDVSSIEFDMIEAMLPEPKTIIRSRKAIVVFPGTVSVFEQ